jgi:hypothetical protein
LYGHAVSMPARGKWVGGLRDALGMKNMLPSIVRAWRAE